MRDYYKILGVSKSADKAAILQAYLRKTDGVADANSLRLLNEAYHVLTTPAERAQHDYDLLPLWEKWIRNPITWVVFSILWLTWCAWWADLVYRNR
jgi:curved DNA-binding protein CbpA